MVCRVFGHLDEVHAPKPIVVEPVILEQPKSVPLVPPIPLAQQAQVVDEDGFVKVKSKKKKKKKQGMDGGLQPVPVSHDGPILDSSPNLVSPAVVPSVGPSVSLGPLPEAQLKQKGKLHVTNQFASLSDPVLETMDDFYDGALGIWESERQYAHFYHDSGLKPPGFVFEKWTPKHKEYYFHLSKEVIKDQGGPSIVVEVDDVTDVDSVTDDSSRFMKLS
ncbi:hypothetical protein L1987_56725 [Smallanthus sonchifolius]|uniref:Uncharacterized protein n=1 Tax=Smallanthus sonchifolius TaxID=185202 RepID=A0ACB9ED73_9ASTR|nr:hypothetical protein L1987_56725 [Smallanthus sonchifolius]